MYPTCAITMISKTGHFLSAIGSVGCWVEALLRLLSKANRDIFVYHQIGERYWPLSLAAPKQHLLLALSTKKKSSRTYPSGPTPVAYYQCVLTSSNGIFIG